MVKKAKVKCHVCKGSGTSKTKEHFKWTNGYQGSQGRVGTGYVREFLLEDCRTCDKTGFVDAAQCSYCLFSSSSLEEIGKACFNCGRE